MIVVSLILALCLLGALGCVLWVICDIVLDKFIEE